MDHKGHIVIAGTPGTGKSSLCTLLIEKLDKEHFEHVNIGDFAKEKNCLLEFDESTDSHILDEDALEHHLIALIFETKKTIIFDYHGCSFLSPQWITAAFILRTENGVLYERLEARGYSKQKIEENVQCEIFQSILDEAHETFPPEIIFELRSDTEEDQEKNLQFILDYFKNSAVN